MSSGSVTARAGQVLRSDGDAPLVADQKKMKSARIPELDGLRGVAILLVICVHYIRSQGPTGGPITTFLQKFLALGWSGVDLFFVLSGFLIGGILLDARASPNYFKTFYARRFFRIIPLYYGWIALYVLLLTFGSHVVQKHSLAGRPETVGLIVYVHLVFLQNLLPISTLGLAGVWFSQMWSLAVEEHFYLVCPFVVRMLSNRRLYFALVAVSAASLFLRVVLRSATHVRADWVYIATPCRADTLAIGVLAALLWRSEGFRERVSSHPKIFTVVGSVLGLGTFCLWLSEWRWGAVSILMQTVGYTWLAAFYAMSVITVLLRPASLLAKWMRMAWLRGLGIVSYFIYITHDAINVICSALLLRSPPRVSTLSGAAVTMFAFLLTYALARLSWRFFERPLLERGHHFKY